MGGYLAGVCVVVCVCACACVLAGGCEPKGSKDQYDFVSNNTTEIAAVCLL